MLRKEENRVFIERNFCAREDDHNRNTNRIADAVLRRMLESSGLSTASLLSSTAWTPSDIDEKVDIGNQVSALITDVKRRSVSDVQSITMCVSSASRNVIEIIAHINAINKESMTLASTSLVSDQKFFEQKTKAEPGVPCLSSS